MQRIAKAGIMILALTLLLTACSPQRRDYLDRVKALEGGDASKMDPAAVEELEAHIKELRSEVEELTGSTEKLGTYYKMLAVDFFDAGMFGPALDYFEKALYIYPENHVLYYYAGVSTARIAKTRQTSQELTADLLRAEEFYLEALRIKADYRDALYAIGVLYVFELNTPERGIPYLEDLALMDETRSDVRFVLARAYAAVGEYTAAAETYREIIAIDPDSEAGLNAQRLLAEIEGETP